MAKRTWSDSAGTTSADAAAPTPARPNGNGRTSSHRQSISGIVSNDGTIPQISRKIKACAACRKHKIKCLMDESGPPCRRCAERNLGCVLSKSLQTIIDEKSQFSESVVQDLEQIHSALRQVMSKLSLPELPPLQSINSRETEGSPPKDDNHGHTSNHLSASQEEFRGPSCDNSPKATPEDEGLPYVPIHSLYTLTKLSALRSPDNPEAQKGNAINDFIARGALSLADAESLFALYRDRLDRYMYGIGCRYMTLEELRRKSPILSAATLTVAALHDPKADNIYGICSGEFRRLMEKSMFERRIDRDYLRAMCVASYWLSDLSWMLSGYAIRRAAECNLHNSYNQAIKEQSQEAADCARLWYILYICDQHLATLYGRPSIVQEDSSIQGWEQFLKSPVATEEDKRLTGQVMLFRRQLDEWYTRWMGELPEQWTQIGSFPRKGTILHYNFAQIHLYSHIFRGLSNDAPIPHYFLDCAMQAVNAATAIIDLIITDPDVAVGIVGMPSYMLSMTAFACMFLIKVAVKYGSDLIERQRVHDLTTNLVRQFRSLKAGKWHLANLMAGGLERMTATLATPDPQVRQVQQAVYTNTMEHVDMAVPGNQVYTDMDGDTFFDYDMSFGLSPVFSLINININTNTMADKQHILITGAGGFIGQEILAPLLNSSPSIHLTITDISEPPVPTEHSQRIISLAADLTNPSVVEQLVTSQPFQAVYLFHGLMSSGSEANLDLGLKVNVDSVRYVLDALRNKLRGVKVVFSSSCAVYGPEEGYVTEKTLPQPRSSYGAEKLIAELLVNDFSRRGLIDGRIVRLPTVVVRPGKPSAAASSFASGIVRESLQGIPNILPVPRDISMWICSPATVIKNLIKVKDIPAEKFGDSRIVNLPGITVSVQDILDAVEKVGGKEAVGCVKEEQDEALYKIVKSWPPWFDASRAKGLGLDEDGELVDAVKAFQERLKAQLQ
ncbi:transcriptional activator of proteases prtT [Fusarium beomiforme]|uniref:Transcriptional activator of proteases prtT n=1 Tax=Fusarium beomiforme TaxID=44412 RepID=A0A9P5DX62_9HYPO|nr:transcriptional activator of proteases prtT [Fusarium beomiforme]